MEWAANPDVWSALATLLFLEVVLGVDNVIFISIIAGKLPADQQGRARRTGLVAAGAMRILLLLGVGWIITLKSELFSVGGIGFSGKDLILLAGGVFLLWKATNEIHHKLEGEEGEGSARGAPSFAAVIAQVLVLDLVFSIDSVITAVGMTEYIGVMVAAVVASIGIMLIASRSIYEFVNRHPTVKMLALAFLLLIGVTLVAEGLGQKIPKGYIYSAIVFSVLVEALNIRSRRTKATVEPVHLHERFVDAHTDRR